MCSFKITTHILPSSNNETHVFHCDDGLLHDMYESCISFCSQFKITITMMNWKKHSPLKFLFSSPLRSHPQFLKFHLMFFLYSSQFYYNLSWIIISAGSRKTGRKFKLNGFRDHICS
jgi:hypothetical protein